MSQDILAKVYKLIELHKSRALGGEIMPEDANPGLPKNSPETYIYFTLPMALNYQRNSYKLWQAADQTYRNPDTTDVFNPAAAAEMNPDLLRKKLLKYKVALQPNKHIEIWQTIAQTVAQDFSGDLRNLFAVNNFDIQQIKSYIQDHKKSFPYLGGAKILNYWLYVMEQYTSVCFRNPQEITVAPDTHVIQASVKLGLRTQDEAQNHNIREELSQKWQDLLQNEPICPIDVHTPMWLWSRGGFRPQL